MKQTKKLWMLAALTMLMGLASCVEHDNPVDPNPLAKQVKGMWYNITDTEGTLPEMLGGEDYTRVIEAMLLNEDGTGYGCTLFLNDEDERPVAGYGGFDEQGLAPFTYTTTTDGRISLRFDQENTNKDYADFFKKWSLSYAGGTVSCSDGSQTFQMELANEAMEAWLQSLYRSWAGGASADNYNINDEDFTPTNWREQEAIYIYDGTGQDATDAKGRTGYTLVNMPWYKGDVLTNLPEGFCDDITPGNGWEWVLNRCGSRNIVNNNFFAVYNKYTGTLRFFYYMPGEFSTGNDHVWQVSMTDHLAQQSVWPYGIPEDKTLTNKTVIGQTGDGTFMTYTTPWTNYMSDDGLITPNAGWWTFDIDLSQTRLDDLQTSDNIRLQMRSWNVQHASLNSTIAAALNGTFDGNLNAELNLLQSQHLSNSAMGITAKVGGMVGNLATGIVSAMKGEIGKTFGSAVGFAKGGCNLAGIKTEGAHDIEGSLKGKIEGTITLGLQGNIDTEGTIRGSYPTVGVASPTIYLKDFDLKNSHLGQGVWNLKTAPVVYSTNVDAWWREDEWISVYMSGKGVYSYNYCQMTPYFFDPNSVEIELNPNIFPEGEIEWVEVDAICGARKSRQLLNDALRSAFGVGGRPSRNFARDGFTNHDWERYYISRQLKENENDILMDFLRRYDDKLGMSQSYVIYSKDNGYQWNFTHFAWTETVKGRGADGYAIEPQYLGGYKTGYIPFLEVNVTVLVKLKSMDTPVLLSRNYLPEIKDFNATEFDNAVHKAKPYASKMTGHTQLYDYQMKRIYTILNDYDVNAVFPDGFLPKLIATSGSPYNYDRIFDGNWETYWQSNKADMTGGVWFVEFRSTRPFVPTKYYMTPSQYCDNYHSSVTLNPYNWRLMAKASEGDPWTTIATVTNDNKLPGGYDTDAKQERVEYPLDVTGKTWQYFRLEILNTRNSLKATARGDLQLSEFDFGTND